MFVLPTEKPLSAIAAFCTRKNVRSGEEITQKVAEQ